MIKTKKFDGVIEAVHYSPTGKIEWVRAYERKGFVFTDLLLLDRETLIEKLEDGKRFFVGQRKTLLGNDFDIHAPRRLDGTGNTQIIITGDKPTRQKDHLAGAPIF